MNPELADVCNRNTRIEDDRLATTKDPSIFTVTSGVSRDILEDRIARLVFMLRSTRDAHQMVLERCGELKNENRELRMTASHEALFLADVLTEVKRARVKHGPSTEKLFAALVEEVGEVGKALHDCESDEALRRELSQVACVALRIAVEGESRYGRKSL